MGKKRLQIVSVRAIKDNYNSFCIVYKIGNDTSLARVDVRGKETIYQSLERYIKNELKLSLNSNIAKDYSSYNYDSELERDNIIKSLILLDNYGENLYNPKIKEYILQV